ncbi:nitrous oxide-stimulated promoter family protein [Ruminococcus sp. 5_1_39BFAA]|uniref:nitrous oxide-stimulated promoter family protein n=1 Tax=Ruminococcus sp. 5_1_39BFAA TaxID=457412 RepID=UPI003562F5CF
MPLRNYVFDVKWEDKLVKGNVDEKRKREKQTVALMIRIYCRKNHGTKQELCPECRALSDYADQRSDKCPFMETKTFCSNCKVHCYKPEMREKIRDVMRFSGPRMIFHHPVMAVRHVIETKKEKKRLEETK